jgi:FixJ family two-component response regulator
MISWCIAVIAYFASDKNPPKVNTMSYLYGWSMARSVHARYDKAMKSIVPIRAGEAALILIVDDDDYVRSSLENFLASAGYTAIGIASAEAYLESGLLNSGGCLILDVQMKGMTGLDLQQRLNSMGDRTPIIFLTAHYDNATRERARRGGAFAFLGKPFEEDELLAAIVHALSAKR